MTKHVLKRVLARMNLSRVGTYKPRLKMAASKDQQRIVALQKQLKIARAALEEARYGDLKARKAEEALDEMNKIEWASKPNLVQGDEFHGRSFARR